MSKISTEADTSGWTLREETHFTGDGFFGYTHQCVEKPRLQRREKSSRATRTTEVTWMVDGADVADFPAAITALNVPVVLTQVEQDALSALGTEWVPLRTFDGNARLVLVALRRKGMVDMVDGKVSRRVLL